MRNAIGLCNILIYLFDLSMKIELQWYFDSQNTSMDRCVYIHVYALDIQLAHCNRALDVLIRNTFFRARDEHIADSSCLYRRTAKQYNHVDTPLKIDNCTCVCVCAY